MVFLLRSRDMAADEIGRSSFKGSTFGGIARETVCELQQFTQRIFPVERMIVVFSNQSFVDLEKLTVFQIEAAEFAELILRVHPSGDLLRQPMPGFAIAADVCPPEQLACRPNFHSRVAPCVTPFSRRTQC